MAGVGEVDIILDGKAEVLKSTLKAAKAVNAHGGFMHVLGRLGAMDQDFYVLVVSAGLDRKPSAVEDAVFKTGLPQLTSELTDYVMLLTNGGKPLSGAGVAGTGEA